jgi:DNA-directed RNA polymerase specialized sigma24 family protein
VANRAISTGLHERQHLPVDDSELEEDGDRFGADVCRILGISEGNQRVLLHRARARIRRHLEQEAVW